MNILLATSEAVPFAKTGGLADVCGALPLELSRLGHRAALILPAYRQTRYCGHPHRALGDQLHRPDREQDGHRATCCKAGLPAGRFRSTWSNKTHYYDRDELYRQDGEDYTDNCERFVFFSRAVLEAIRLLELDVDVIHANDWQTGLVPAYLKIEYRTLPRYERIATLFTIHNIAYQGQFWHWDMLLTGLDWKYFNWRQMEFYGKLNLLKTGLVFADSISTVSPRYAEEIQTPQFGRGLEGVLQHRRDVLSGILNGIDDERLESGHRPAPGRELQRRHACAGESRSARRRCSGNWGWPRGRTCPLIGMIGRLDDQKGFDLVAEVIPRMGHARPTLSGRSSARASRTTTSCSPIWPSASRTRWPSGWNTRTRWPIASRPGPTSSSCPAGLSPAG